MNGKIEYQFTATIWQYYSPKGSWYFVSVPQDISTEIRENLKWQEEGWGRLKVRAKINDTNWDTAIWFNTKSKEYMLPLKAGIRLKEKLELDDSIQVTIGI